MPTPVRTLPDLWFPARRAMRVVPDLWFPRAEALATNPLLHRERLRPVPIGVSIAAIDPATLIATSAGSSGLFVVHGSDIYCLSANHILSLDGLIATNYPVIQPGFADGGTVVLDTFAHNSFYKLFDSLANEIDVALAHVDVPSDALLSILENGLPSGSFIQAVVGMQVQKSGRTTGLTQSTVVAVNAQNDTPAIAGLLPAIHHVNQILVDNPAFTFAAGGDSGAGLYDLSGNLVGLVSHVDNINPNLVSCSPALPIAAWLNELFPPPPGSSETPSNALPIVIAGVGVLLLAAGVIQASRDYPVR